MIPGTLADLGQIYGKVSPDGTSVTVKHNTKELVTLEIPTSKDLAGMTSPLTYAGKEYYLELTWEKDVLMEVYGTAFDNDRKLRKTGSPREVNLIRHDIHDPAVPAHPVDNPPPDLKYPIPVPSSPTAAEVEEPEYGPDPIPVPFDHDLPPVPVRFTGYTQEMRTVAKHLSYDQLSYLTEGNHNTEFFCKVLEYVDKEAAKKVDPAEASKLAKILATLDNQGLSIDRNSGEAARYILGRMAAK
jgi:hypothetical protein